MTEHVDRVPPEPELGPVARPGVWLAWGVTLQAIGVGIPVTVALRLAHRDGLSGGLTHYTVRLVWHEMLASGADLALVGLGVALFVGGCVVLARPLAARRSTILVKVPVAALAGIAFLGVAALLVAWVIAAVRGEIDWGAAQDALREIPGSPPRRRRK